MIGLQTARTKSPTWNDRGLNLLLNVLERQATQGVVGPRVFSHQVPLVLAI